MDNLPPWISYNVNNYQIMLKVSKDSLIFSEKDKGSDNTLVITTVGEILNNAFIDSELSITLA